MAAKSNGNLKIKPSERKQGALGSATANRRGDYPGGARRFGDILETVEAHAT
jgi:hypothetical protein